MINIKLTVAEIVQLLRATKDEGLVVRLTRALVLATHQQVDIEITGFSEHVGIIPAIKVLRAHFGWGLKTAKDFCDDIRGSLQPSWESGQYVRAHGKPAVVTVPADTAHKFMTEMTEAGASVNMRE